MKKTFKQEQHSNDFF